MAATAAGCGGGDANPVAQQATSAPAAATAPAAVPTTTTPTVATTAPSGTAPSTTPTAPTATTGVPPGGTTGEQQPGGAGDEEAIRVPAAFEVREGAIVPRQITVPAYLPVALEVTAVGAPRHLTVDVPDAPTLDIAEGGTARRTLPGLKPGDYAIVANGGGRAVLHVTPGGDAGP